MDISFECEKCGRRQKAPRSKAGRLVLCRTCRRWVMVRIPEPTEAFGPGHVHHRTSGANTPPPA